MRPNRWTLFNWKKIKAFEDDWNNWMFINHLIISTLLLKRYCITQTPKLMKCSNDLLLISKDEVLNLKVDRHIYYQVETNSGNIFTWVYFYLIVYYKNKRYVFQYNLYCLPMRLHYSNYVSEYYTFCKVRNYLRWSNLVLGYISIIFLFPTVTCASY